jgi:mRNA-degrading endonuclease RelE of RelBE toxin-antitoxin system
MFEIAVRPTALKQLRRLRRVDAVAILDALDRYLRLEPDRPSRSRIKRLRGPQDATYRLRVGEYRVFYDIGKSVVTVVAVLHKRDTAAFYREENA